MTFDKRIQHQVEELVAEAEGGALGAGGRLAIELREGRARLRGGEGLR